VAGALEALSLLCEMCGKEYPTLRSVKVEGTVLMVCASCSRFGEGVQPQQRQQEAPTPVVERLVLREKRMQERDIYQSAGEEVIVEDFPLRVRQRRESLGWSQEELAKRLNERKSIIQKVETGTMTPGDKLVKKLEGTLGIRLKEKVASLGVSQVKRGESRGVTLGDLVSFEKE
jgi:putative transcription factor